MEGGTTESRQRMVNMILDGYMNNINRSNLPKDGYCLYVMHFPHHKIYVGISSSIRKRMGQYISGNERKRIVGKALLKHGLENVWISAVDGYVSWDLVCSAEKEEIARYNSFTPNGYNATKGGEGTVGMKVTDTTKNKIGKANKDRKRPDLAERNRQTKGAPSPIKGKKKSEEHKIAIRKAKQGSNAGTKNPNYKHGKYTKT